MLALSTTMSRRMRHVTVESTMIVRTRSPTSADDMRHRIHGMIHCSGGAQTKVLHFIDRLHVIKDNLFPTPSTMIVRTRSPTSAVSPPVLWMSMPASRSSASSSSVPLMISYETDYNGGMGSNGLTSARHDVFAKYLAEKYPESFDAATPAELIYSGSVRLTE